jgi:hypothetical protein
MSQRAETLGTVHVRQHLDGWSVEHDPLQRDTRVFFSRDFAITAAHDMARRQRRDLFVHDGTGQVERVVLYAEDSLTDAGRWKRKRTSRRVQPHAA